jgi:hypothetical protein
VHRHERLRFEFIERAHRFFWVHMHFTRKRRIVRTDRQKRDLDVVTFTDFLEALEIRAIAAMKNGAPVCADHKTAETTMSIRQKTRAPMMRWRERNSERAELDHLPFIELVHNVETESMHQPSDADWNNDRLIGRDQAQRATIEMIEMRVGHEHEIDQR